VTFYDFTSLPTKPFINAIELEKLCTTDVMGYVIQINMLQPEEKMSNPKCCPPPEIQEVLDQYVDVFSDQMGLPPHRNYDNHIPLLEGSEPPNVRPYKIPHKQKDEVEKLIKSMLQDDIIRPRNSPYSSPAILVRKKDGS
jgi:hypothetical protein